MPLAVTVTQTADPASVSTSSGVATYSSVGIGTASNDRIVMVGTSRVTTSSITSATIDYGSGAVAMNKSTSAIFTNNEACFFWLRVPTGTTATIAITFSGAASSAQNHITVYSVNNASDPTFQTATSTDMDSTSPLTISVTVPVAGAALGVANGAIPTTANTWANFTADLDENINSGFRHTTGFKTTSGTTTTTLTGTTNAEDGAMVIATFGPLPDASRINSATSELPRASNVAAIRQSKTALNWTQALALINTPIAQFPAGAQVTEIPPRRIDRIGKQWVYGTLPLQPDTYMPGFVEASDIILHPSRRALSHFAQFPLEATPPGKQTTELPRRINRVAYSWTPYPTNFLIATANPIVQTDWPVPRQAKRFPSLTTHIGGTLPLQPDSYMPGFVESFDVPPQPSRVARQWTNNLLLEALPPGASLLGNPRVLKPTAQTWIPNTISLLSGTVSLPPLNFDTSVPRRLTPAAKTHIGGTLPLQPDTYMPGMVESFDVPLAANKRAIDWTPNTIQVLATTVTTLPPGVQTCALPRGPAYPHSLRTHIGTVSDLNTYVFRNALVAKVWQPNRGVFPTPPVNMAVLSPVDTNTYMPGTVEVFDVPPGPNKAGKEWIQTNIALLTATTPIQPPFSYDTAIPPRKAAYPNSLRTHISNTLPLQPDSYAPGAAMEFDVLPGPSKRATQWTPSTITLLTATAPQQPPSRFEFGLPQRAKPLAAFTHISSVADLNTYVFRDALVTRITYLNKRTDFQFPNIIPLLSSQTYMPGATLAFDVLPGPSRTALNWIPTTIALLSGTVTLPPGQTVTALPRGKYYPASLRTLLGQNTQIIPGPQTAPPNCNMMMMVVPRKAHYPNALRTLSNTPGPGSIPPAVAGRPHNIPFIATMGAMTAR